MSKRRLKDGTVEDLPASEVAARQADQAAQLAEEQAAFQQLQLVRGALREFPEGPIGVAQAIDKVVELVAFLRVKYPDDAL